MLAALVLAGLLLLPVTFRVARWLNRRSRGVVVGVFHPYAMAMGGGERVLWCGLAHLLKERRDVTVFLYTGDHDVDLGRVRSRFGAGSCPDDAHAQRIHVCKLYTRRLVEADLYPRFTLLGQSLGSVVLGLEAVFRWPPPAVWWDSMGYAFTYPAVRLLAGCSVACYVHFPTISADMLRAVQENRPSYNNDARVARSSSASALKLAYYHAFALAYKVVGRCASVVMCNSTWTSGHIASLWGAKTTIVYPPCLSGNSATAMLPLNERREPLIVSIGQFRPEKDHRLQLASMKALRAMGTHAGKLVMIGSCRNAEDCARVEELRAFALSLGLVERRDFEFRIDVSKAELDDVMHRASLGVHTMWNEHFGIGIVEMMACGMVVVAHDSGGPKSDIVLPNTGFLASTEAQYAKAMHDVLDEPEAYALMRQRARDTAMRFTEEEFGRKLMAALRAVLPPRPVV